MKNIDEKNCLTVTTINSLQRVIINNEKPQESLYYSACMQL